MNHQQTNKPKGRKLPVIHLLLFFGLSATLILLFLNSPLSQSSTLDRNHYQQQIRALEQEVEKTQTENQILVNFRQKQHNYIEQLKKEVNILKTSPPIQPVTFGEEVQRACQVYLDREQSSADPLIRSGDYRKVYAYYEFLPNMKNNDAMELIAEWEKSWKANCWIPIVLNHTHAMTHPKYEHWSTKLAQLPTVNDPLYENACYLRHLAMAAVGGGLMVDFDVINLSFKPDDMVKVDMFTTFEGSVPSMVYASTSEYERIIDYMANYQLTESDRARGKPHISDMHILYDMATKKLISVNHANSPIFRHQVFHVSYQRVLLQRAATGFKRLNKKDVARVILALITTQLA